MPPFQGLQETLWSITNARGQLTSHARALQPATAKPAPRAGTTDTLADRVAALSRTQFPAQGDPKPQAQNQGQDQDQTLIIDQSECIACGTCVENTAEVFTLPDEGKAVAVAQTGPMDLIEDAIDACPVTCIHWTKDPDQYPQWNDADGRPLTTERQGWS